MPDLREIIACRLYARGVYSLGKAAEWSGLNIEQMKRALHRQGVERSAPETLEAIEAMADAALRARWQKPHMSQFVVIDADFLSAFLKIERLPLIVQFYQIDEIVLAPAVYREVAQTTLLPALSVLKWIRILRRRRLQHWTDSAD